MEEPGIAALVWIWISNREVDGFRGRASMGYLSSTSQTEAVKGQVEFKK